MTELLDPRALFIGAWFWLYALGFGLAVELLIAGVRLWLTRK